ncbi:hypothetical protein [Streptomyces nigrescens]
MSGLLNIVVITEAVALVFVQQFKAQRITSQGKKWWLIPAVLTVVAVRQPGLPDPAHHTASAVLLGLELLIGLACGAGWAWTTHLDGRGRHGVAAGRRQACGSAVWCCA